MNTHQIIDHGAVEEARARMLSPRSAREAQRVMMCLCDPTRFKIAVFVIAGFFAGGARRRSQARPSCVSRVTRSAGSRRCRGGSARARSGRARCA